MHDLVLKGGFIVDGSGAPGFEGDVAIDGARISVVDPGGKLGLRGLREIDARGKLVTPGFVDIHTHYDAQVSWDPYLTPSSWHGCTTVVMGNCGVGFAPVKADRRAWLVELMEGVEDIPGSAMTEGITWNWESFPDYLNAIAAQPHAIDFGCQVTHGALRGYVMGDRGAKNEDATEEDKAQMYRLTLEALRAGALGFSTSRTMLHKSKSGEPVPGTFAKEDEIFAIGAALKDAGHGVFQLAAEHLDAPRELTWMRALAAQTGRTVSLNLNQTPWGPDVWREVITIVEAAQAAGENVLVQVPGRSIGVLLGFRTTAHPFVASKTFQGLADLPWEVQREKLQDASIRAQILADEPMDLGPFANFVTRAFAQMYLFERGSTGIEDYEPDPETSLEKRAHAAGVSPGELAYDAMLADGAEGLLYLPLFNYAYGDLDFLRTLHLHAHTRLGLSDAGAHCGAICDGGMPTFMLTHWTRDRTRGPKMSLERVVFRQSREAALLYGLADRGLLAAGLRADINVIDYDGLSFDRAEVAFDFPAGGRRLVQRARGYRHTFVAGTEIVTDDSFTGAMPGKLVRGPQNPQ